MAVESTISAIVLFGLDEHLESHGIDPFDFGKSCGISDKTWNDAVGEVPLTQFVQLMEHAAVTAHQPGFGWIAGGTFNMLALGDLGEAILHAPTLGVALSNFARFLRLIQSTTELRLEIEKDCARLVYRILDPDIWPRQQDAEFSLSVIMRIFSHFLGSDWRPTSITFEHNPNQAVQGWNELVGTDCYFSHGSNIIAFPADLLSRVGPAHNREHWTKLNHALDQMLVHRNRRRAVSSRVKSAVFANLGRCPIDQNTIATELGLSRRSLHRRLEIEGTKFSELLATCRMKLARQRLVHGDQPLSRIAIDLNYSDQSAFTRAFKQNCGVAPHRYRRQRQTEIDNYGI